MIVWLITITIFWYTTLHNLAGRPVAVGLARYHSLMLTLWYLAIIALVLQAFWGYWTTLL
jgi:hypothetical protein